MRSTQVSVLHSQENILTTLVDNLHLHEKLTNVESLTTNQSYNPFLAFASELVKLIEDTLRPALKNQKQLIRLSPDHLFFERAKAVWHKYGWPEQSFENFQKLLCGLLNFPVILLMNPKNDHLPFEEMVLSTQTLKWLKQTLQRLGLTLDDIIIMELFPMLTDSWLDTHLAEREEAIREIFDLTVDFLREFKPPIVLSCQCFPQFKHKRWGSFNHTLVTKLCSSMFGAENQHVSKVSIDDQSICVVQGFHPAKLDYLEDAEREKWNRTLQNIFQSVYRPCVDWKTHYQQKLEDDLDNAATAVRTVATTFYEALLEYEQIRLQAIGFGMASNRLGNTSGLQWHALRDIVSTFVQRIEPVTNA